MHTLSQFQTPEIQRAQLDDLCLQIVLLRLGKIESSFLDLNSHDSALLFCKREFLGKAIDRPSPKDIKETVKNLREINALDEDEDLTPLGMHLARLPVLLPFFVSIAQ
jgi:HrpA-like RNA helicase